MLLAVSIFPLRELENVNTVSLAREFVGLRLVDRRNCTVAVDPLCIDRHTVHGREVFFRRPQKSATVGRHILDTTLQRLLARIVNQGVTHLRIIGDSPRRDRISVDRRFGRNVVSVNFRSSFSVSVLAFLRDGSRHDTGALRHNNRARDGQSGRRTGGDQDTDPALEAQTLDGVAPRAPSPPENNL